MARPQRQGPVTLARVAGVALVHALALPLPRRVPQKRVTAARVPQRHRRDIRRDASPLRNTRGDPAPLANDLASLVRRREEGAFGAAHTSHRTPLLGQNNRTPLLGQNKAELGCHAGSTTLYCPGLGARLADCLEEPTGSRGSQGVLDLNHRAIAETPRADETR